MKLLLNVILVLAACSTAVNSEDVTIQRRRLVCHYVGTSISCTATTGARYPVVKSGQQVALKIPFKKLWLGCAGKWCRTANCPGTFFTKSKAKCWGEVFTIYSRRARGQPIKVGDQVGLYYNKQRKWIGSPAKWFQKYTCPGRPSHHWGFQTPAKWNQCQGQVYTIYAMGKCRGQTITHKDAVMFRYKNKWMSQAGLWTDKRTCPGTVLPPLPAKYDKCAGEAFEIYKL